MIILDFLPTDVSIVYVVHLHIVFLKAALQKRGSMEPMEPPRDPPLYQLLSSCCQVFPYREERLAKIGEKFERGDYTLEEYVDGISKWMGFSM